MSYSIGHVMLRVDIPSGSTIDYDSSRNRLVVRHSGKVYAVAQPFLMPDHRVPRSSDSDPRVRAFGPTGEQGIPGPLGPQCPGARGISAQEAREQARIEGQREVAVAVALALVVLSLAALAARWAGWL